MLNLQFGRGRVDFANFTIKSTSISANCAAHNGLRKFANEWPTLFIEMSANPV